MGTSEDPLPSVRRIIQGSRGCGKCAVRNHDGLSAFQPDRRGSCEESRVSNPAGLGTADVQQCDYAGVGPRGPVVAHFALDGVKCKVNEKPSSFTGTL